MVEATRVKSISIKSVGYSAKEIRKLVEGTKEQHFLARVGGVVLESFGGESKHGQWTAFKGIFSLVNRDGSSFTSTTCFVPGNITKKILEQLAQGVLEVEFVFDIFVSETDKNASGYSFASEPVMSDAGIKKADAITSRVLNSKLPTALKLADNFKKKSA